MRQAFCTVWNGIFDAIEFVTGKALNFKIFTPASELLEAIGDAEGTQAQELGDVILSRHMNTPYVQGVATTDPDTILKFVWKTCQVHFIR